MTLSCTVCACCGASTRRDIGKYRNDMFFASLGAYKNRPVCQDQEACRARREDGSGIDYWLDGTTPYNVRRSIPLSEVRAQVEAVPAPTRKPRKPMSEVQKAVLRERMLRINAERAATK